MDNKDNTLIEDPQAPATADSATETVEVSDNAPPEKSKTGRGLAVFSLLLALLALLSSGWIFYQTTQGSKDKNLKQLTHLVSQQDFQQLVKRVSDVEQKLTQQANNLQQNQQNLSRLQQDLRNLPDHEFDASGLEQQINTLQQQLKGLQSQYREQAYEPQTDEHLKLLTRAQTISALKTVQLLITQKQIPEAMGVLKQWRNNEYLPLAIQTRLQQLVTTLSNVDTPDLSVLKNQLSAIKNEIARLSLTVETQESEQPAWYERFITVKKIKPEQQDLNSVDLQQLKANANHSIQQAELALVLQQPSLWHDALKAAEQTLSQTVLNTDSLQHNLRQLRQQTIVTQVPENLGIDALILQLEGISE